MATRYDSDMEDEVVGWFKALLNEDIGSGQREVERALRSGILLVKLAQHLQANSTDCPPLAANMKLKANMESKAFKEIENIQNFVNFCEYYGVRRTSLFQPPDLYGENVKMFPVLSCIRELGSAAKRNGFQGKTIGAKPQVGNYRKWTDEKLKEGDTIIGIQAGSNKYASQKGMSFGVRHAADIRADDITSEGHHILNAQSGYNRGCNQSGMSFGAVRHGGDIKVADVQSHHLIPMQSGVNTGINQSGMTFGGVRHGGDIKVGKIRNLIDTI